MAERRTRVLHLITRLDLGGAQQNTLYCVEHHDRARFDVALWAGAGGLLDADARRLADADVRLLPWLVHPVSPARDGVALVRLVAALRRFRPHVVHTHSSKAGILGRCAARLAGVPAVVHTVHGWSFNETQPARVARAYRAFERLAAAASDAIVCVAEADRDTGIRLGIAPAARFHVIRSGIDRDRFAPTGTARAAFRREVGFEDDAIVVGTLACLKPQKAPLDFVAAAAKAHRADPRLRFFLAGDGEMRGAVEREIETRGLAEVVRVLGWRRDPEAALAGMDIFLLTSRFEGLPRAVLQAMAAGVPVVATAVCGTPEVVRDGETGILVPPARPERAAEVVVRLAGDPGRRARLAAAARARLGDEFDIRGMIRSVEAVYDQVLSRGAFAATSAEPLDSPARRSRVGP